MKKLVSLILLFSIAMASTYGASWPPSSAEDLNAKWLIGEKKQVLEYGQNLLKNDSEDILGLLIQWNYSMAFMDIDGMRNTGPKLKRAVAKQNGIEFSKRKSWLISDVDTILDILSKITPEMAKLESRKGFINGKPMDILQHIQDLEIDGYFKHTSSNKLKQIQNSESPGSKSSKLIGWIALVSAFLGGVFFLFHRFKS